MASSRPLRRPVRPLNTAQQNIRDVIEASGSTVNNWAAAHGLVQSTVYRTVIGEHDPSTTMLAEFAKAIGVRPWELLYPALSGLPKPAGASSLSPKAHALGLALDRMTDEQRRARAYALALQIIQFENEGAPPPLPHAPQPAPAPKRKQRESR